MAGSNSTDGAAAFEYHKAEVRTLSIDAGQRFRPGLTLSQLVNGIAKVVGDLHGLQVALQNFSQFVASASFSPNGQAVFSVSGGKLGQKRKFKDEDGRKVRKVKDPNAPRRPASSYILFQNEIRPSLKEKFPGLTHTELMNRVSKLWSELPQDKKEVRKLVSLSIALD
jgi:hypothetical protein